MLSIVELHAQTFLQILCKACKLYDVVIHDYCLMENHYHLLLETRQENLSLSKQERNRAIIEAFKDGYTQSSIANYLKV